MLYKKLLIALLLLASNPYKISAAEGDSSCAIKWKKCSETVECCDGLVCGKWGSCRDPKDSPEPEDPTYPPAPRCREEGDKCRNGRK